MIPFKKKKKNPIIRERTERILPSIIHHVSPRFSIVGHNRDTDFRKLRNSPGCTKSAPCFSTSNTFVTFIAAGSIATTDLHRPCEYKRKDIYSTHIYRTWCYNNVGTMEGNHRRVVIVRDIFGRDCSSQQQRSIAYTVGPCYRGLSLLNIVSFLTIFG